MKHKTRDLSGALLDAAVALCHGYEWRNPPDFDGYPPPGLVLLPPGETSFYTQPTPGHVFAFHVPEYSSDWSQGGVVIERKRIAVMPDERFDRYGFHGGWLAMVKSDDASVSARGPTPLIAAMRVLAVLELGDEVDMP